MKRLSIEKIIIVVLSAIFALLIVLNGAEHATILLSKSLFVILGILWLLILSIAMYLAGAIVVKSLFKVAAGLSLVIFLAQSYCLPEVARTVSGDQALKLLMVLGLAYVMYDFLTAVYLEFKERGRTFKEADGRWKFMGVVMVGLLFLFIATFVFMVYQVVSPIVLGLCIYK